MELNPHLKLKFGRENLFGRDSFISSPMATRTWPWHGWHGQALIVQLFYGQVRVAGISVGFFPKPIFESNFYVKISSQVSNHKAFFDFIHDS